MQIFHIASGFISIPTYFRFVYVFSNAVRVSACCSGYCGLLQSLASWFDTDKYKQRNWRFSNVCLVAINCFFVSLPITCVTRKTKDGEKFDSKSRKHPHAFCIRCRCWYSIPATADFDPFRPSSSWHCSALWWSLVIFHGITKQISLFLRSRQLLFVLLWYKIKRISSSSSNPSLRVS